MLGSTMSFAGRAISNASDGNDAFDVSPASPKNNPDFHDAKAGFTPFDKQQVFNGDEIVWRNVSIARGPTTTRAIEWFSRGQPGQSGMSSQSFIYPASQSPRRAQLLDKLGVAHQPLLPDADEDAEALEAKIVGEAALDYVQRVTGAKLGAARTSTVSLLPVRLNCPGCCLPV
jgi:hypothetical protein